MKRVILPFFGIVLLGLLAIWAVQVASVDRGDNLACVGCEGGPLLYDEAELERYEEPFQQEYRNFLQAWELEYVERRSVWEDAITQAETTATSDERQSLRQQIADVDAAFRQTFAVRRQEFLAKHRP